MKLRRLVEILDAVVFTGEENMDREATCAFASDLMSDVLALATANSVLLTGLTTPQVVRTADVLDISAIVLVRGKKPPQETIALARELGIPLIGTSYIMFETAGRLFAGGMVGSISKVVNREGERK
ncbi:MAG: hypothetical protein K9K75_01930 [Deltaproteobacteria bacterium]|nr:hypothetical protein [Deltaproteobacteria bacterium]